MRPLKFLVVISALASAILLAQQNPPANPQANPAAKPPADKPTTQADRASTASSSKDSWTWTGTIVNATCSEASNLPSAGSHAAASTSSSTSSPTSTSSANKNEKSVYDLQKEVFKHCAANEKATAFAVLTDDGKFYKLDDAGNTQVTTQATDPKGKKKVKDLRVTVTGTVEGDIVKVQSLTKTDKPFGGTA
jgi:hypothetical protein